MPFTSSEIREIRGKLDALALVEKKRMEDDNISKLQIATAWWNTIKPKTPTDRNEALAIYHFIERQIVTEVRLRNEALDEETRTEEIYRLKVLRNRLEQANIEFKERKADG